MVKQSRDLSKAASGATRTAGGGRAAALLDQLSPSPDWSGTRALTLAAIVVALVSAVVMSMNHNAMPGFRDTDDAMRLVMVRDLLAGRGWYDQLITRLDPPAGLWPHWSRLWDGGIASLTLLLRPFMPAASAEYWTRYLWPLLWIFPGVAAALALARNLGARGAVFLAGLVMLANDNAYRQFVPGRIDHHDGQIVMTVIAMACATARQNRTRWAWVGGAAAAFGLAIGLEALPLQALIGASYGVALMRDREARGPAAAYGLSLALVTLVLFLIQTPPARWSLSFCDALALNLTLAILVGGSGLALTAGAAKKAPAAARVGLIVGTGVAALAAYLALDPMCVHGPFAAMNPAVKPFWFDRVQEVQSLDKMMVRQRGAAIAAAILIILALASAVYLAARRWREKDTSSLLLLVAMILAAVTAWFAWRMQDYVYWLGLPAFAAALSWIAERRLRGLMIPSALAALVLSPAALGAAADWSLTTFGPHAPAGGMDAGPKCFARATYLGLAALPPGNVLAPQDLGPFILVYTKDSAVSAPYHRLSDAILAVHQVWAVPPPQAEARVRALHADYVADCPPYPLMVGQKSFGASLRKNPTPPWLRLVSTPKSALKVYKVLPSAADR